MELLELSVYYQMKGKDDGFEQTPEEQLEEMIANGLTVKDFEL